MTRRPLLDGLVTGIALSTAVFAACKLTGRSGTNCTEWLFYAGTLCILAASVWAAAGYHSPPGILSVLRGDAEVYPSAQPGSLWIDRFIQPGNVWVIAGLVTVLLSFLLLVPLAR
jgi:hypothetical protein